MTNEFKELQDMLYAFGVVLDDIHIPIIAPSINPSFYCCQKGLYYKAQLIQYVRFEKMILDGLVALMIGQFFQNPTPKKIKMKGIILHYRLTKNVAYPMRPWFQSSFKGEKNGMPKAKMY